MMLQGIKDGCLPELEEVRKLNAFLTSSHSVHGNSTLSPSQLTHWIARICLGIQEKATAILTCQVLKRKRSSTPIQDLAQPEILPVLRYVVLCINAHYHGLNNHLMYNVTWHESGSSNALEPYANVHHLDALTVYEQRLEASTQTDFCKALCLLQRNKEKAALLSEDDTDTEMTQPEKISQQSTVASTSQGASSTPTLSCPSSQEQSD
jgi:hypothetical protein